MLSLSGTKNIGGARNKENQDVFFVCEAAETGTTAMGIFDGHGTLGQLAAVTASESVKNSINTSGFREAFAENSKNVFKTMFHMAHEAIQSVFVNKYDETRVKFGVPQYKSDGFWMPISGGTTASVVVIIDGRIHAAHVGDSTIVLRQADTSTVVLGEEHSVGSMTEYQRMRKVSTDVRFEYDNTKGANTNVFYLDSLGTVQKNEKGFYYKNIHEEFADLVSADGMSLAFTRTLGDFTLQKHGVSHEPSYTSVDVGPTGPILVIAASDGVWDHWTAEECASRVHEVGVEAFMVENDNKGKELFRETRDNASIVACTITI